MTFHWANFPFMDSPKYICFFFVPMNKRPCSFKHTFRIFRHWDFVPIMTPTVEWLYNFKLFSVWFFAYIIKKSILWNISVPDIFTVRWIVSKSRIFIKSYLNPYNISSKFLNWIYNARNINTGIAIWT